MPQSSLDNAIRLLQEVPFFAGVNRPELIALASACQRRPYRRNEVIFHRDDPGEALHIVQTGQVRIELLSPQGEEIVLALFQAGDFFGELSLLDGLPRSATAVATEPTVTLTLTRAEFQRVLERTPPVAQQIIVALSARLRHTDVLLGDAIFLNVQARLAKRLFELSQAPGDTAVPPGPRTVRVTQTELATMVGATRESVNKELHGLQARGLIQVARGRVLILHPESLRPLAIW